MAVYQAIITNVGRTLFQNAGVGAGQIFPVSIVTGDGTLGSTDPTTLGGLVHPVQYYDITSSNALVPYQSTYQFVINSTAVITSYQLREVGLMAKLGTAGVPVLVAYHWTTDTPDTISPSGGASASIDYNSLTIAFSSTPNTIATISPVVPPALHAVTHLQRTDGSSTDPLPVGNTFDVGFIPRTPGDASQVLVGTSTASWAAAPRMTGEIIDWAGLSIPTGWLPCDGSPYSTTGPYANLFAVIGYQFGGTGPNFNVPDCRGRVSVGAGQGTGLANRPFGSSGGEENHLLTTTELPSHAHGVTDSGHVHSILDGGHSHSLTQSPHSHILNDPGHVHAVADAGHAHSIHDPTHTHALIDPTHVNRLNSTQLDFAAFPPFGNVWHTIQVWPYATDATYNDPTYCSIQYAATGITINGAGTGIGIFGALTGMTLTPSNANISINNASTGISINGSATGISIQSTGGSQVHNNMMPYLTFNKLIKF